MVAGVTSPACDDILLAGVLNALDTLAMLTSDRSDTSLLSFFVGVTWMALGFIIFILGDFETLCSGANSPKLMSHSKYLFPSTEPSFLPIAASSSTPAQSPFAKSVGPKYLRATDLVKYKEIYWEEIGLQQGKKWD